LTVETSRLASGLTIVTERVPDLHSASVGFWVGTGSRDEEPAVAGASHFLEHLLFKGTAHRSARDIAEAIDAVGGEMNAFTTKEYTAFYVRVLGEHLDLGLDILSDIMWAPAFRPDEVDAERQVILEEILMRGDEPADLAHELVFAARYPDHPLGRDVLGDEETIEAMGRDDIRAFFEHHYRPGNMVVAAAGAVDHGELVARIEAAVGAVDGGAAPARVAPAAPAQPLVVMHRPTEQAHVVLAMAGLDRADVDRYALAVVDQAFGGGMSSRLFQEVREQRGLAYSVYSWRSAFADAGLFGAYAGTAPERTQETLAVLGAELDRLGATGITSRELEVAKGHLRGSLLLGLEDSGARMSRLGRGQLVHHEVLSIDEVVTRVEAVTLEDANRVAGRLLAGERTLAVVGPFEEDDFGDARVA
jgi:predicted Zn-dependent peptidase